MTAAHETRAGWRHVAASSFPALVVLYLALFGAYGTESPFFPSFLSRRGLSSADIGIVLSAGTVVRLLTGPLIGVMADFLGTRLVLAAAAIGSGTIILLYLAGASFWPLLLVCLLHSVVTAPLSPLADALALNASAREGAFPYGWVRGIGSAGFILGTLASGAIVARFGTDSIIVAAAVLFLLMGAPIPRLPPSVPASAAAARGGILTLLAIPLFRLLLIIAGLVIGSHAMNDTFTVIHWREAGVSPTTISVLWSESVASEIVVFVVLGPLLLRRLGPGRCAAISAVAGILRWGVLGATTAVVPIAAVQLLHGLTFSLMHLACMQVIAAVVPERLSATAQTLYGTLCLGIASAALTFLSGELYGKLGAHAFWLMAGLCLVALPLAARLKQPEAAASAA